MPVVAVGGTVGDAGGVVGVGISVGAIVGVGVGVSAGVAVEIGVRVGTGVGVPPGEGVTGGVGFGRGVGVTGRFGVGVGCAPPDPDVPGVVLELRPVLFWLVLCATSVPRTPGVSLASGVSRQLFTAAPLAVPCSAVASAVGVLSFVRAVWLEAPLPTN